MAGVDVANPASDRPPLDPSQDVEEGEILSPRALLPSAEDPQKKHPLEHSWTFWFDSRSGKSKSVEWGSSLKPVYTFSTVEDFWCLFNNVHPPTQLVPGSDFHCFKEGIKPEWEDPKCANGGKWTISFSTRKPVLDVYWLHTLLALIGEQLDEGDEICGVVASVRPRGDKLSLWTKTATNEAAQMSVGKQWKQILDFSEKIGYLVHEDSKGTRAKARYNV